MKKLLWILILVIAVAVTWIIIQDNYGFETDWTNWGRNLTCNPQDIYKPKNKQELIEVIKNANSKNQKIRAFGSSHSWSPIVCTGALIDTSHLNKIISVDNNLVKIEAGIKVWDLNERLRKLDLALPNQSFTQAQSIAGNILTATHGTGKTGSFASFIESLELVTPTGELKEISRHGNKDLFSAVVTSIGNLGVIYSVTLKCEPLFKVAHKRTQTNIKDILANYKELNNKHDFFQFFWNPYTDGVLTYTWDKTDKELTTFSNYILKIKDKGFTGHWTGAIWKKFLDTFPSLYPSFISLFQWLAATGEHVAYPPDIMSAAEKSNQEVIYEEEEIAIPVDSLKDAIEDLRVLFKKYQKENFYPLYWGVLFRFTEEDKDNLLSMTSGDKKIFVSVTAAHINNGFYKEFEDAMLKYNGRPHWGKINFLDYNRAKKLYGDNLNKFIKIKKELDPKNLFTNDYIERVFSVSNGKS